MIDTSNDTRTVVVGRNPETGATETSVLTEAQEGTRTWFAEHMLWAFGRPGVDVFISGKPSVVADAVRGELRATGMPDHMIEKALEDVIWALIRGEWRKLPATEE